MAHYLLSMYYPDGPVPAPEVLAEIMADLGVVQEDLQKAGKWVFAGGLMPSSTATVVSPEGALVTDGPYLEGKEHLGGFTVIEADDLDDALEWGRRTATASRLPIEVRPFQWREESTGSPS